MRNESEISTRPAKPADAGAIAGMLREAGWFPHIADETVEETRKRVEKHLALCGADDSHTVLTAMDGETLARYISVHWLPYMFLEGPEGYISELFVLESFRGRGIGGLLLKEAKKMAEDRGCSRLMLVNGRARESYIRGFYAKTGFVERPDIANFVMKLG